MIKRFYSWLYRVTARKDERGEYSGGRTEGAIRSQALSLLEDAKGKVLEIGFGSGLFVLKLALRRPDLQVFGVDTNQALLESLKKKARADSIGNLNLDLQDAKNLKFADDSFDRVVCINLFLNVDFDSVKALLIQMKRVCRRGGSVVFEFRNSRNIFYAIKYKLARFYDETVPYPLYMYDPDKIDALLRELGLKVLITKPLGFPPMIGFGPIILIEAQKT